MRLVPRSQHTPSSDYWAIFHMDFNNRGGYHEWARPAGAPVRLLKSDITQLRHVKSDKIPTLTRDELADYFKKSILENNHEEFIYILRRAEKVCFNEQLQEILNQTFTQGAYFKQTTLLHLAIEHGNPSIINSLINRANIQPHYTQLLNQDLDTPAHIAAKHNRANILQKLILSGSDLCTKNKKNETVHDILVARKFSYSLEVYQWARQRYAVAVSSNSDNNIMENYRDPAFTYGGNGQSASQTRSTARTPPNRPFLNMSYSFKDVIRKQFGEARADYFIKKSETAPATPIIKYTFKDSLKKQFGEKNAEYFVNIGC